MTPELTQIAEIAWSAEGKLTHAEGACEALFGRAAEELIGLPLGEVLGVPEERVARLGEVALRGEPGAVEFVGSRTRAGLRTLRLGLGVRAGQAAAGVLDLTAALVGAPPLQLARLAPSFSHELRNPLSSVKMAVQTLAKNPGLSERDRRRLAIANREIRTMERMLSLFSEYGRDTPMALETVPLRSLVQGAAALVEPEMAERNIQVALEEEEHLPRVRCELGRLSPVLAQVLLNAAEVQPSGSTVTVTLRRSEGCCQLVLVDAGTTLPPQEPATLFEPFASRLGTGAGLALAALQRAMQRLGGDVQVQGGATGFVLTLTFPDELPHGNPAHR